MKSNSLIKVIVILGPTSSGKSAAAINIAKYVNGEIISADSRQIYKEMDLGTGKVEGQWRNNTFIAEGIAHHLIDFVDPRDEYNISHFKKDCYRLIGEIHARGNMPIICGGTGFWISAVVDNVTLPEVKPDPSLRKKLAEKTIDELLALLHQLDPARARSVDKKNKVRLIRAIEIAKTLGKVPPLLPSKASSTLEKLLDFITYKDKQISVITQKVSPALLARTQNANEEKHTVKFLEIGLTYPTDILDLKIKERLQQRFDAGMVAEVKRLKDTYNLSWEKIQSFGLGYYWIPQFLQGKITEEEMKERTYLAERNYAKRQRTWFRRDKRITWMTDEEKIKTIIKNFMKK